MLVDSHISLAEFLLVVLDPAVREHDLKKTRWQDLFADRTTLERILGFFVSPLQSKDVQTRTRNWMVAYVARLAGLEGRRITEDGWMRSSTADMTKREVLEFDMLDLYPRFQREAPVTLQVNEMFATSLKQAKQQSERAKLQKQYVSPMAQLLTQSMSGLLRAHSRMNNKVANFNGLYLYATGAQRQTISVLSHLGYCCSYPLLVRKGEGDDESDEEGDDNAYSDDEPLDDDATTTPRTPKAKRPTRLPGIIQVLSSSCMDDARRVAAKGKYKTAYDNVVISLNVSEQTVAHKGTYSAHTVESGTAMTVVDGHRATDAAFDSAEAEKSFLAAGPLLRGDVIFTREEQALWDDLQVETVEWVIVRFGGDGFARFDTQMRAAARHDPHQVEVHKSDIHPLRTAPIDEASITGNIDVVNEIHKQLKLDPNSPEFLAKLRIFLGDQLTISRIRSVIGARAGHERDAEGWRWAKPIPAFFHTDMAGVSCVLTEHWGKGSRDPGSLSFDNIVLDRKPIVTTSLPPFHTCRHLIFTSLYARVLSCLQKNTGASSLDECAKSILTWDELQTQAKALYSTYASTRKVAELRREREHGGKGDVVFENSSLLLRDSLGIRTFSRLIKSGRSGHIILALKWFALVFKAGGCPKYAREMLYLIHHLQRVWPAAFRDFVLNNWFVNPTGTQDGFVSLDHMQEHLNFWIKKIYVAHGSNASWEWLGTISPCIDVLRKLANRMHARVLGNTRSSYQGRKHTSPDLKKDINSLMESLERTKAYDIDRERVVSEDTEPVPDLVSKGLQMMTHGPSATIKEYSAEFATLQARVRVRPLQPFIPNTTSAPADGSRAQRPHQAGVPAPVAVDAREDETRAPGQSEESRSGASTPSSDASTASFFDEREFDELCLSFVEEADVVLDHDAIGGQLDDE
ncbi:hypothetical protein EXIGLDRAFT_681944 [Exidia glandulosa HHB12029]|uniref:DUF6589 domain-containing protein n=1 Tax=Exidia glandulosa HHB12029 TaxID=1314781 RepID=A0A165DTD6_EXIGL|nr:hypothetical protein EXIGLDRAFT_681944 [Exidia glandulosa HHB12029]